MSTEKAPQDSGSGTDPQAPNIGANTGGNPFLPFDQNQTRQFFEVVKILFKKSAKPEEQTVNVPNHHYLKRILKIYRDSWDNWKMCLLWNTGPSNKTLEKSVMQPIYCIGIRMTSLETQPAGINSTIWRLMPMWHREYEVLHKIILIQNRRNGPLS